MIEIDNILQVEGLLAGIELVVFDLDDTLYSEKEYVRSGFSRISEAFKLPRLEQELWDAFLQNQRAIDVVFEKENMNDRKTDAVNIYRNQMPSIHLYEGVWTMLNRIKNEGHRLALLTDGRPKGQRAKIEALQLGSLFDKIVITDELGGIEYRKPSDAGFVLLHEQTKIPFSRMVYIGDNIRKDFQSPQKLLMKCIFFNNRNGLNYQI